MPDAEPLTVTTNGVRLRGWRDGTGPAVLLLHGYMFGAAWWEPQVRALRDAYQTIAVDSAARWGPR